MTERVIDQGGGSRLLQVVETITITPEDVTAIVDGYMSQCRKRYPRDSMWRLKSRVADMIIQRYSRYAMVVGGATGIPGILPGFGSIAAAAGSALADAAVSMKLQADMCMCLAQLYGRDISTDEDRYLTFLIAATGRVQREGDEDEVRVGSEAGVDILRSYLRGAALQAVKQAFRKVGVTFTRRALAKAIPFGIGVVIGGGTNYALTRYVGREAKQWFIIDSATPDELAPATPVQGQRPDPDRAAGS